MNERIEINTIEELVALAMKRHSSTMRYTLEEDFKANYKEPTKFYLHEAGDHWSPERLYLSSDLGNIIDAVWTKGPRWRGHSTMVNKGAVTLKGILKRLGKTDISEQIEAAQKAEEGRLAKARRNNQRQQIRAATQHLQKLIGEYKDILPVHTIIEGKDACPVSVALLVWANLKDEE